jgi:hypothetical protein
MMAHDAIPLVDGKKSHEQDELPCLAKQYPILLQLWLLGNILGKHVSVILLGSGIHRVNKPIVVVLKP